MNNFFRVIVCNIGFFFEIVIFLVLGIDKIILVNFFGFIKVVCV